MKKIIIGFLILILFFLIALIWIIPTLVNQSSDKKSTASLPFFNTFKSTLEKNSFNQSILNNKGPTSVPLKAEDLIQKTTVLDNVTQQKLDEAQKTFLTETNQLTIPVQYSALTDTFVVSGKEADKTAVQQWFAEKQLTPLTFIQGAVLATSSNQSIDTKINQIENNIIKQKEKDLQSISPYPTLSPIPTKAPSNGEYMSKAFSLLTEVYNSSAISVGMSSTDSTPQPSPTPQIIEPTSSMNPSPTPSQLDFPSTPLTLSALIEEVGAKVGVPKKILEGVLRIESPSTFSFTSDQVGRYSQPGAVINGCKPNECSATGPMQMTIGVDGNGNNKCPKCPAGYCPNAWAGFGSAVNRLGGYSHSPNPCNLRDNLYGAASKLKQNSQASDPLNWTQEQVYRAALRYYGNCNNDHRYSRLGNRTYCEFVWYYYTTQ